MFRDPAVEPTTERINAALGGAGDAWDLLNDLMEASGVAVAWRYYRDGGWLAKATRRNKTVAWLNVVPDCARVTFYFAERYRETLVASHDLSAGLRGRIATVAPIGRSIPVSFELHNSSDVGDVGAVLGIKLKA